MHEPGGPRTPEGNYELQQQYLLDRQRAISGNLFEKGVPSRIVLSAPNEGAIEDFDGFAQLDKLFVPALLTIADDHQQEERELCMVAITESGEDSKNYSYFKVGRVDDIGIVLPYEGITSEDANAIWEHASELLSDKETGVIPDLTPDLLSIDNPTTLLMYIPPANTQ